MNSSSTYLSAVMGQQQKRISHDSVRCLLLLLLHFTIRQYIMLYLYISTLSLCMCMLDCVCAHSTRDRHRRGRSVGKLATQHKTTIFIHTGKQASKYTNTRKRIGAHQMRPSTSQYIQAQMHDWAWAGARSHSLTILRPSACVRERLPTRSPVRLLPHHLRLLAIYTICTWLFT